MFHRDHKAPREDCEKIRTALTGCDSRLYKYSGQAVSPSPAFSTRYQPPGVADREFWLYFSNFVIKTGPDGSGQPSGFIWTKFQAKPSILDPLRNKFDVFGPDQNFGQPVFGLGLALDRPHCSWEARPDFNICLVSTCTSEDGKAH